MRIKRPKPPIRAPKVTDAEQCHKMLEGES
jgi:hypothetical protein